MMSTRDSEGKIKHQSTCYRLFLLFICGDACLTSGILERSRKFGFRLQYSVFEIHNSETVLRNIQNEIENIYMKPFTEEDSVIIFNLSATCTKTCYGYAKNEETDVFVIT